MKLSSKSSKINSNSDSKKVWLGSKQTKFSNFLKKRPSSEIQRKELDVTKLSQIKNFKEIFYATANDGFNSALVKSDIKHKQKKRMLDIESGMPKQDLDRTQILRRRMLQSIRNGTKPTPLKVRKKENQDSNQTSDLQKDFLDSEIFTLSRKSPKTSGIVKISSLKREAAFLNTDQKINYLLNRAHKYKPTETISTKVPRYARKGEL